MQYNINYDIAAIIIILLVVSSTRRRNMTTGIANRTFNHMLVVTAVTSVLDILSVLPGVSDYFILITSMAYYIMQEMVAPLLVIYVASIAEALTYFRKPKQKLFFSIPFALIVVLILTTPLTGWIFEIVDGNFFRGEYYGYVNLCTIYYLFYAGFYLIKYKHNMAQDSVLYVLIAFPIVIIGMLLQIEFEFVLLQCFSISIAFIFYTVTIQRPEALLDNETKLYNKSMFMKNIQHALSDRHSLTLCLFKIEKAEHYMSSLSVDTYNTMLRTIAKGLREAVNIVDKDFDIYYLKHGLYAVVARSDIRYKTDSFMDVADQEVLKELDSAAIMMTIPNIYKCVVRLPEDIAEFSSLPSFLDSLETILPRSGPVYRISDMEDQDKISLHINISGIIERALNDGEFSVRYAPIYDPTMNRIVAANAQLYLKDSRYGEIPPQYIWRMAENSGEIERIGDMMYDRVCRFVAGADFKDSALRYVQMKLSVSSFENQYLCSKYIDGAKRYGVEPTNIALSLAETSEISDWSEVAAQVQLLRFRGFKVGLEDYGAYNSNIRRISSIPFTALSLDEDLVRKGCEDAARISNKDFSVKLQSINELILTSTIEMVRGLGIKIIATGVDNLQAKEFIETTGCEYIMGDYFGDYLPLHDFLYLVRSFNQESDSKVRERKDILDMRGIII